MRHRPATIRARRSPRAARRHTCRADTPSTSAAVVVDISSILLAGPAADVGSGPIGSDGMARCTRASRSTAASTSASRDEYRHRSRAAWRIPGTSSAASNAASAGVNTTTGPATSTGRSSVDEKGTAALPLRQRRRLTRHLGNPAQLMERCHVQPAVRAVGMLLGPIPRTGRSIHHTGERSRPRTSSDHSGNPPLRRQRQGNVISHRNLSFSNEA